MAKKKRSKAAGARKKSGSKKQTRRATGAMGGAPVSTGKGPGPAEIGASLVDMFNRGMWKEVEDKWWSPKVVSVEGLGVEFRGRKAVQKKNGEWMADHVVHSASAEGPFVGATGFAVHFNMDVEQKSTGQRHAMTEVGVYTVQNGKIVREEFMYGKM